MENEVFYAVYGKRLGDFYVGKRFGFREGEPASVSFDAEEILLNRDYLLGFFHTHPSMSAYPSITDMNTMEVWCDSLGKDLLCAIQGDELRLWWWSKEKARFYDTPGTMIGNYIIGRNAR